MKKILYLNSFTVTQTDYNASDAVGYGITSSDAICHYLKNDYTLIKIPTDPLDNTAYLDWTLRSYHEVLHYLKNDPPDAIFIFHSFQQFPQEIKKMLYHLKLNIPIIGYTHGSHWDPTDTFRHLHCPELHLTDLANLYCLDAILFVTHTFKDVVIHEIKKMNAPLAEKIAKKSHVVGLPINTSLIDTYHTTKKNNDITIVFNHAPVPSKNLMTFLQVMQGLLPRYNHIKCYITRHLPSDTPEYLHANALAAAHPGKVFFGKTLPLKDYYTLLWNSDIQVSTASHESLGIATLEAMYTHNCCLLPRIGAYPEISAGISEHLYSDVTELTKKLTFYIENAHERYALAGRLALAANNYSMEKLYSHFQQVIADC